MLYVCTTEKCLLLEVSSDADCYQELVLCTLIIIVFGLDTHSLISTDTCVIQISLKERKANVLLNVMCNCDSEIKLFFFPQ